MAYGRGTSHKRTFTKRSTAASSRASAQKAARAAQVARRRAPVKAAVRSRVSKNSRAIKKLELKQRGPRQQQISFWECPSGVHVIHDSPFLFHVNDPIAGDKSPQMYHINNLGNVTTMSGRFAKFDDDQGYHQKQGDAAFNPPVYLTGVKLEFEVKGFCDNTRVRIDIIRQKKLGTPFFIPQSTGNFLPHRLDKLKGIAGFHPNELNREFFEVMATRKLFFNSKGSANLADTTADRNTLDATTTNVKYTSIYVPVKKELKPMEHSTYEGTGLAAFDDTQPFHWEKMYPTHNIWCLISTDDQTDFASVVTGDAITVNIIRKCYWRDPL